MYVDGLRKVVRILTVNYVVEGLTYTVSKLVQMMETGQ